MSRVVRRNCGMPVFSATAIQISGTNTPSRSKVTIDCFTRGGCFQFCRKLSRLALSRSKRLFNYGGDRLFAYSGVYPDPGELKLMPKPGHLPFRKLARFDFQQIDRFF